MNLLVTGAWNGAKENISQLKQMGHTVLFMQYEKDQLPCEYSWVEGIIGNGIFLSHPIEKFVNLKYIQLTSAGFDRVPMDYVKRCGIEIYNARGVYSIPMAEFVMAGILQLYKHSSFFYINQKAHRWEKHRDLQELAGKKVCIVGCGSVGTECAKRFKAFGCKIIGVDLFPRKDLFYDSMLEINSFDRVLPEVDIVVLTLPLTEETKYIMNAERFSLLKDRAIIVNIARGLVVDTEALIEALQQKLGGAVLDVFEEEPLEYDSPLWDMENVIITPHNSFVGENNDGRLSNIILENLEGRK